MRNNFKEWKMPEFDKDGWTKYGWRCQYPDKLRLGNKTDIGCFTYMNAKFGIEIDDLVQIGSHCSIYSVDTEVGNTGKVKIGKGSRIGSFCLILPGAVIEPYSRIRAYSIIKGVSEKNVGENEI